MIVASAPGFAVVRRALDVPGQAPVSLVLAIAPYQDRATVVSAAGRDRLRENAGSPISVVGGEAIRDAGYESVSQALREIAGMVTRRGSEGAPVIGEQIQGIDSRQVLVLIDGQPIVGARGVKSGIVNLDRESTAGLERVEVVKGAASALYGSDAIGGVINIIPREAKRAIEIGGRASTGSFGATDGGIDAGGHFGRGSWFASGGRHQRRSFDLTPSTLDTTGAAFRRTDASARVSAVASASWLLSGNVTSYWNTLTGRSNGELGPQEDKTPSHSQTYGLKAQWRPDAHTTVEARAYTGRYSETSNTVLLGDGQTALEPCDLFQSLAKADWLVSRAIGDQHLIRGGIEWIHDRTAGGIASVIPTATLRRRALRGYSTRRLP